jgi:hypothetical protein
LKAASEHRDASRSDPPDFGAWLPGFAWALPAAFGGAVSSCRFEQGDVLHATRTGYADWGDGSPGAWIQVLDPPRSARALGTSADASRFETQWGSPVGLELAEDGEADPRRLETTQGRLFTCLWRGELAALESRSAPEPPLLLGELQRRLEAALPGLRERLAEGRSAKRRANAMLLVTALDRSSDASLAKADTIAAALAARFEVASLDLSPLALSLPDADRFHPPLQVRGARIEAAEEGPVTAALKAALYTPGARRRDESGDAAGEGESDASDPAPRGDRFSVARHGLLVPLDAPDP